MVKSVTTVCSEIYDEVRKLAPRLLRPRGSLRVNPDVARALRGDEATVLKELCALLGHERRGAGRPAAAPGAVRRGAAVSEAERDRRRSRPTSRPSRRHLRARRGVEHILSPRDFALARGLVRGGRAPGHRARAHGPRLRARPADGDVLASCRRRVEELAAAGPGQHAARAPAGARPFPRWRSCCAPCSSSSEGGAPRRAPSTAARARSARSQDLARRGLAAQLGLRARASCARSTTSWRPLPSGRALARAGGGVPEETAHATSATAARSTSRPRGGDGSALPSARPGDAAATAGRRRLKQPVPASSRRGRATKRTPSERRRLRWTRPDARPSSEMRPRAPTTRCHGTLASRRPIRPRAPSPTARAPRGTPTSAATWP